MPSVDIICMWLRKRIEHTQSKSTLSLHWRRTACVLRWREEKEEMGGIVMRHHQISAKPLRKAAFPGSFALQRDIILLPARGSPPRASSLTIRAEANGALPPRTVVKKHSKEELIDFFGGIQAAIARDSPRASRRTRKPSPADAFEDAGNQSYEKLYPDGQLNLEDMKVPELKELAKARRMRGYSKLKKGELIDLLKGGLV